MASIKANTAPAVNEAKDANFKAATTAKIQDLTADFSKMAVGVGKKSYHVTSNGFAVYDNLQGAVKNTGNVVAGKSHVSKNVKQALLTNREEKLKVLDKAGRLCAVNIETGRVVQTWKTERNDVLLPQTAVAHAYKGAGYDSDTKLLVSVANKSVSLWDFRGRRGAVAEYKDGHDYSSSEKGFTCLATGGNTGDSVGTVVVGSKDGSIKVFSGGKVSRASAVFAGLGDPITSIDITCNNEWVVATTDKYLLVANMKALEGDKGGYQTQLFLKPEDAKKAGNAPFSHGRFSYVTEKGLTEDTIAASCGQYVIYYNFRSVKLFAEKKNSKLDYKMLAPAEGQVLDSQLMHTNFRQGTAEVLLAATEDALYTNVL